MIARVGSVRKNLRASAPHYGLTTRDISSARLGWPDPAIIARKANRAAPSAPRMTTNSLIGCGSDGGSENRLEGRSAT